MGRKGETEAPGPQFPVRRQQFRRSHLERLEGHVVAVVKIPVLRFDDPVFLFQLVVDRRTRERGHNAQEGHVNSDLHQLIGHFDDAFFIIMVKTGNEAGHHSDTPFPDL
ncbi:MAG: hypothetical protein KDD12_11915 [Lewinella sp.]|nr:hypothetical protein [Lewinella sp.]